MNKHEIKSQTLYREIVEALFEPGYVYIDLEKTLPNGNVDVGVDREYFHEWHPDLFLFSIQDLSFFYESRNPVLSASLQSIYSVLDDCFRSSIIGKIKNIFESNKMKIARTEKYIELVAHAAVLYTSDSSQPLLRFEAFDRYCEDDQGKRLKETFNTLSSYEDDVRDKFNQRTK